MTFKSSEKSATEKLREFEKADLEEYCKQHGIKGLQKEKFIENFIEKYQFTKIDNDGLFLYSCTLSSAVICRQ